MTQRRTHHLTVAAFLLCCVLVQGARGQDVNNLKRGEHLLTLGQYALALSELLPFEKTQPGNVRALSAIGISYFQLNNLPKARTYLQRAIQYQEAAPDSTWLYLGKLHHHLAEFEKSAIFYKNFLRKIDTNHPLRSPVKDDIRRCATGLRLRRQQSAGVAILNLGEVVNTSGDDFKPLYPSSQEGRLYFSSIRPGNAGGLISEDCCSDMFYTEVKNGDWASPERLGFFLNGITNEVLLGRVGVPQRLYFFRGENFYSGDLLVDTLRQQTTEQTLVFREFDGTVQMWDGDCEPFFFNDSLLLFASRRPGGYGGLDLYFSVFSRGFWSPPSNLGPVVNSAYDDTSPYLANDGRTLYFSTNDPAQSFGGLDILKSVYTEWSGRWSAPENPGLPLNSAGDDEHFFLDASGSRAFFASARKEGLGRRDLYVGIFNPPRPEQVAETLLFSSHLLLGKPAKPQPEKEAPTAIQQDFFNEIASWELPAFPLADTGLSVNAMRQLRQLAQLLREFPETRLAIALHAASSEEMPDFCEQAALKVQDLLRLEGAAATQLVFHCSAAYPAEVPVSRLEVYVSNPEVLPFEVHGQPLSEAAHRSVFFQKAMTRLCYGVLAEAPPAALPALLRLYPQGLVEMMPGRKNFRFSPGLYLSFASAEQWQRDLADNGYPEARITPYLRGVELTREAAAAQVTQFPDLKSFLRQ